MRIIRSKSSWQLGLRRRHEALTPNDRVSIKKTMNFLAMIRFKRMKLLMEDDASQNLEDIMALTHKAEAF